MRICQSYLGAIFALLLGPQLTVAETLNVQALGCVLSLPNVENVTVAPPSDVSFYFRESEASPLEMVIVTKYPGDESWFSHPNNGKTDRRASKLFNLDEMTITVHNAVFADSVFRGLTDKKVVLYFYKTNADLSAYVKCNADAP